MTLEEHDFRLQQQVEAYFPDHAHVSMLSWAAEVLAAMDEPALSKSVSGLESYRFLWLRCRHQPVAVRVAIADGGSRIITNTLNRDAGYNPGSFGQHTERDLAEAEVAELQQLIDVAGFWEIPTTGGLMGLDGSEWILEGVRDGQYHVVVRWCPTIGDNAGPFRAVCEHLLRATKLPDQTVSPVY